MIVSIKDIFKMTGMLIISFCAIIVCTMFLNYHLDLLTVENLITTDISRIFYDAQCNTCIVVSGVSGGCLLLTTVVLLCFYIGHYIETHQKQLGIMKALGYSRFSVIVPSLFFALSAVAVSYYKLKIPALWLIREQSKRKVVPAKKDTDMPFLQELEKSNVRQRKSLIFFITFAVFCFAAMTQMSCSMDELASQMMSIMIMAIGIVLAVVTLFIATTSVINANSKTITMMKVFGYSSRECANAVLNGYRPWAYLGFVLGTIYQYVLLKIMVSVVFKDVENVPDYQFDFPVMLITLAAFLILYEAIMFAYTKRMEKLSVKEIMLD